ncbi:hypothetical protein V6R21_27760 [Limibacter armeniacum]|uniref:hypothetical protein n=1 Tax=Limibacter armeniacum TaxID=466084 RepID=UPI002FE571A7
MKSTALKITVFILSAILISSCIGEPEFDEIPEITFKEIRTVPTQGLDSVIIKVEFQDGNGDLGLDDEETDGDYAQMIVTEDGDTIPNQFFFNYFIDVLRKEEDGEFRPLTFQDNQEFNGRYPKLNTSERERPLQGDIDYSFALFVGTLGSPINEGDSLKFRVQIADRSRNLSNEILTDGVEMKGRVVEESEEEETGQ